VRHQRSYRFAIKEVGGDERVGLELEGSGGEKVVPRSIYKSGKVM
jgi:hypothetical protein